MNVILDSKQIRTRTEAMAAQIVAEMPAGSALAVVGIRSRGEILAQRLAACLAQKTGQAVPCGTLDITLYRDDLNSPHRSTHPQVRTTDIAFDVDDKVIVLVDDVLFTGRSTRAALDALIDLGRPRAIRLAVLIDRAGREFPIQADYAGIRTDISPDQRVYVRLTESDGRDEVVVE
ncbi:MAG: bifunctional pyr operon transcriptional regulator/uracil phosphoribosyltransferase PyrR [Phycisphaerae bacterium]|nr:bifunctional pyr operon transcriptional regulator/uracil phosphoribosyltransferase PyrR [Phycisphaerae bacterium]